MYHGRPDDLPELRAPVLAGGADATEIGDMTVLLTGVVDAPLTIRISDSDHTDSGVIGEVGVSLKTQLPNRL